MSSEDHSPAYRNVLLALLALTLVTVYVGVEVHFNSHATNIVVGILIAIVKASLVTAVFMHMRWEKRWWLGLVLFPVLLVMIIIFSNFVDTGLNNDFTTPAESQIQHAGQAGHAGPAH